MLKPFSVRYTLADPIASHFNATAPLPGVYIRASGVHIHITHALLHQINFQNPHIVYIYIQRPAGMLEENDRE